MLKSALGDRIKEKTDYKEEDTGNEEVESGNYETLSQHSDSIMECGPKKRRPGTYPREARRNTSQGTTEALSHVYNDWLCHFKYFRNVYERIKNNTYITVSSPIIFAFVLRSPLSFPQAHSFSFSQRNYSLKVGIFFLIPVFYFQFY